MSADSSPQKPTPSNSAPGSEQRLRLLVAYDGRPFAGWQSQTNGDAIQDRLEAAFTQVCDGPRIVVHGSGRTDAGVHARGQVAHADVPDRTRRTPERWRGALNANLPPEIRVLEVRHAPSTFHARFSASGKIYRYRLWNGPVLDPLEAGRAWHFPNELNLKILGEVSQQFVGRHDFAAFSANRGHPVQDTFRTIRRVVIRHQRPLLTLEYEGDGFLYKMVRLLTGSLVRCAQGRASSDWVSNLLAGSAGKTSFAAPAEGLYLMRVLYGKKAR